MQKGFDPHAFIDRIAAVSRSDGKIPDPDTGIGRQCYAFSRHEDAAFNVANDEILKIVNAGSGQAWVLGRADAIGNVFVKLLGSDRTLPAFMIHSHLDSVQDGGKFDGVAGVASALDSMSAVASGEKPIRSLRLGVFRSEESSPHNGVGCLGSSVATGTIALEALRTIEYTPGRKLSSHILAQWDDVRKEVREPEITRHNTAGCLEIHIEQSDFIARRGAEIGIVVGGVGGAWRKVVRRHTVASTALPSGNPYLFLSIDCAGVAGHTGALPPNPRFVGAPHHRKDALVASCMMALRLMRAGAHLVSSEPHVSTGFTSIPSRQLVQIAVHERHAEAVKKILKDLKRASVKRFGVEVTYRARWRNPRSIFIVSDKDARRALAVAPLVSRLSTHAYKREGTEFGLTRATVTDLSISFRGLSFKLDGREVDPVAGAVLEVAIFRAWQKIFGDSFHAEEISRKKSTRVDPSLVQELKDVATDLRVKYIEMPSVAGHDTDRLMAAGIPGVMLFIRQDEGVSHSPFEKMESTHFDAAQKVAREFVRRQLLK